MNHPANENALREQGVDTTTNYATKDTEPLGGTQGVNKTPTAKALINLELKHCAAPTRTGCQTRRTSNTHLMQTCNQPSSPSGMVMAVQEPQLIDLSETRRFLDCLGKEGLFTFQTFGDENKQDKTLTKILHGTLDQLPASLEGLNSRGAGIFLMVNEGNGKGRKKQNVMRIRAVFVDLDGAPLNPILTAPLLPHMVIESSPKKYHAYWLVDDLPLEDFSTTQMALARLFHGDPSVKDLPRVMRMPGFFHRKRTPFRTHILEIQDTPPYSASELLNAFEINLTVSTQAFSQTAQIDKGNRNNAMFQMATTFLADGILPNSVLTRLLTANKARCNPPLPESEVIDIWKRVCQHMPTNSALGTVVTNPALAHFSFPARWLYAIAHVRAAGSNGSFSLTLNDCAEHGFSRRQRQHALRKLQNAGLLVQTRPHHGGVGGGNRQCALFTLGVEIPPKQNDFRGQNCHGINETGEE